MRCLRLFLICIICLFFMGCAGKSPEWGPEFELQEQVHSDNGSQETGSPGSLWSSSSDTLFTDSRASSPGDIVTVVIYEEASASKQADTATGRSSSVSAGLPSFFGLEGSQTVTDNLDLSNLIQGSYNNEYTGSGSTSRQENLSATITTQVVSVLPNGNMRIQGRKRVVVNKEEQYIGLSGIVRRDDINSRNMVDSRYVLDAEILYTGSGPLSDKQKPGWFIRIMDNVWPF